MKILSKTPAKLLQVQNNRDEDVRFSLSDGDKIIVPSVTLEAHKQLNYGKPTDTIEKLCVTGEHERSVEVDNIAGELIVRFQ